MKTTKKALSALQRAAIFAGKTIMTIIVFLWGIGFYVIGAAISVMEEAFVAGYQEAKEWLGD